MRTQKQINAEIETLVSFYDRVQTGRFTDNQACIEAQIEVLRERLDEDDIYVRWDDDEYDMDVRTSALDALKWMNGETDCLPSDEWKPLLKSK